MLDIAQVRSTISDSSNLDLLLIKSGPGGIRGVFGGYSRGVRRVFGSNLVGNSWEISGKIPEKFRENSGNFINRDPFLTGGGGYS